MDPSANPYAPPKHDGDPDPTSRPTGEPAAELEAIRRAHINAEANIKGLGFLLFLGTAAMLLSGLAALKTTVVGGVVTVGLGAVLGLSGYWLRKLDARGRLGYSIFVMLAVVLALLDGVSVGTVPNLVGRLFWPALFLAVIWGTKATRVMTPHYRDVVIPATPHVKHKTSPVVWVLLGILVLGIVAMILVGASR